MGAQRRSDTYDSVLRMNKVHSRERDRRPRVFCGLGGIRGRNCVMKPINGTTDESRWNVTSEFSPRGYRIVYF